MYVIVNGEYGLCLYTAEGEEPVIKAVAFRLYHLLGPVEREKEGRGLAIGSGVWEGQEGRRMGGAGRREDGRRGKEGGRMRMGAVGMGGEGREGRREGGRGGRMGGEGRRENGRGAREWKGKKNGRQGKEEEWQG